MRSLWLAAFLGLALFCFGCKSETTAPERITPASTPAPPPAAQAKMPWKIALVVEPAQPKSDQTTTFRVKIEDEKDRPIEGAQVSASLVMKLMDMGKSEVKLNDSGGGFYEGSGKFTMTGPWSVVVSAKKGKESVDQAFDLAVRE